jgi:hypothetical protein
MRWLSFLTLGLAFAALLVGFGVAHNRQGWSVRTFPANGRAGDPGEIQLVNDPPPGTGRNAPEADRTAKSMCDQIRAEIAGLGEHPWAGEYYSGDGLGVSQTILVAPKAGYVFEWHGCLGLYDRNYGSVTEKGGRLTLSFAFPNPRNGMKAAISVEMIPLRWGERHYLLPADDVADFCNKVHQGWEPRRGAYGLFFLRRSDRDKPAGTPGQLPPEFQEYLLPEAVEVTVTAVGPTTTRPEWGDHKVTPVTFDAGTKKGLRVGTELFVRDPDGGWIPVKLTKVEDDRTVRLGLRLDLMRPHSPDGVLRWCVPP